ncbi:MAG: pyridoxal-phosphate dependent enzyme [Dehalococcoidia bacterium]
MDKSTTATVTRSQLRKRLDALPRVRLSRTPTPLEDAPRLSALLGGPRILIKREDTTGLAFGGNKGRHFEFEMAHITEGGYDTVINVNDYHSNQARFIAAGCAKLGLRYLLVSTDKVDRPLQGNLLLCKLMGAEIHRVAASDGIEYARKLAAEVTAGGGKPYIVNDDLFPSLMGMIGFLECGLELEDQLQQHGLDNMRVWGLAGRSIPGLRLFSKNRGLSWKATAVRYSPSNDEKDRTTMIARSHDTADLVGLPVALEPGDIDILTDYAGPGYGIPYDGVFEAIHMVARSESLILDPNYTGKSMAALIGEIRAGRVTRDDTVVFIHSGGLPQVFAFAEELAAWSG